MSPSVPAQRMADFLAIQQLGDDRRGVDKRRRQHLVGLPGVDHGAGAVGGGEDDRFTAHPIRGSIRRASCPVRSRRWPPPGVRRRAQYLPPAKLLGQGQGVGDFKARDDLAGAGLQGIGDRGEARSTSITTAVLPANSSGSTNFGKA